MLRPRSPDSGLTDEPLFSAKRRRVTDSHGALVEDERLDLEPYWWSENLVERHHNDVHEFGEHMEIDDRIPTRRKSETAPEICGSQYLQISADQSFESFSVLTQDYCGDSITSEGIVNASLGCNATLIPDIANAEPEDISINHLGSELVDSSQIVCYGRVCGLSATYEQQGQGELPVTFPVYLNSPSQFSSETYKTVRGRIQHENSYMLQTLLEERSVKLYAICILGQQHVTRKKCKVYPVFPCSLDIIVYGPYELSNDIGSWFQDYEIYLQDPESCPLEGKYCNPQRMSSEDFSSCLLVSEVISKSFIPSPKELPEPSDYLDILSSHVDLDETPQPSVIRAVLKRHQKQALTFMLNREEGWGFNHKLPDVWETTESTQGRMFVNTISSMCQAEEPPQFYGGIIADPMGLGKTLTMIALVATDLDVEKDMSILMEGFQTGKQDTAATLVIIPPPILGTWEKQLEDHVAEGALIYRRHHGKVRLASTDDLDTVNIVLTTYHTVAAEWKSNQRKSPLFSVRWKRIILDEAHFIRNGNSRMATAICALDAVSRWAVTGTPIQNRLGDLASLLKFIRAHPYTDPKRFDTDISRLWKSGEDEEAVRRLKRLSTCLLLRRAKATINLPLRRDLVYTIEFSPDERAVYERIRQQTIARIDEVLGDETGSRKSRGYVNVLQQIESLRLFSNLGLFYDSRHEKNSNSASESEDWSEIAQRTFNSQQAMSTVTCCQCASALGLTETLLDDSSSKNGTAQYTSCLKFVCSDCVDKLTLFGQSVPCGHTPPCQSAPVSTSSFAMEEVDTSAPPQLRMASIAPPSKVKSLLEDIKHIPTGVKCVVFSTWRLTLDLVKAALDHQGIQSIRFDGNVPQKDRQSVVEKFESDPSIQVMLLTLSCGAVGLTLTAASRAYLMEPHWNPTLEEQALARIHRLGQTQEVTTIRLYMRDSFEEQVMNVQESKKQLAGVLLSPHDNGRTDSSISVLERLRSLL